MRICDVWLPGEACRRVIGATCLARRRDIRNSELGCTMIVSSICYFFAWDFFSLRAMFLLTLLLCVRFCRALRQYDFLDVYGCPTGACLARTSMQPGFSGPASSFFMCHSGDAKSAPLVSNAVYGVNAEVSRPAELCPQTAAATPPSFAVVASFDGSDTSSRAAGAAAPSPEGGGAASACSGEPTAVSQSSTVLCSKNATDPSIGSCVNNTIVLCSYLS